MTRLRSDDGLVTGNPEVVRKYNEARRAHERRLREWIDELRAQGVRAAHPNDGWVDRAHRRVNLCHPHFDDGVRIGDLIAIGEPQRYRLVRATWLERTPFKVEWWHYEPFNPSPPRSRGGLGGFLGRLAAQLGAAGKRFVRLVDRR